MVFIPEAFSSNVFAMLALENIEKREEMISGGNTSSVNGILIHPKTEDQHPLELQSIEESFAVAGPECSVHKRCIEVHLLVAYSMF